MSGLNEFDSLDATALAGLVRKKEVKPLELVDAAIERVESRNPALNAVITPMYDQARREAEGNLPDGPFTGVPFLVKDIGAAVAGVRMTMGSAFLKDFIPDHDSELTVRLKRSGLIFVGKTNTPELGILPTTESKFLGRARNPWNVDRTTGGSSGGSAAAVAAGLVPFATASDGGGSTRIP
ncbi:MAG TPA: amidase, partial [Thermodesulfobacteriota bacterium]|nr:amidase [Thermodesulfobacteriota bacterium]